jgi:hypothetical protein
MRSRVKFRQTVVASLETLKRWGDDQEPEKVQE